MPFEPQHEDERGANAERSSARRWRSQLDETISVALAGLAKSSGSERELSMLEGAVSVGFTAERKLCSPAELIDAFVEHGAAAPGWVMARAIDAYLVARSAAVVGWARGLRHDLRNSLGTAANALALLREELSEGAAAERLRSMASRNLGAAGSLARTRLGDAAVLDQLRSTHRPLGDALRLALARQPLASQAVRIHELPATAATAVVGASALTLILSALAVGCDAQANLRIVASAHLEDDRAELIIARSLDGASEWRGMALAQRVSRHAGGALNATDDSRSIRLLLPIVRSGDQREDLARRGEREHRNAKSA